MLKNNPFSKKTFKKVLKFKFQRFFKSFIEANRCSESKKITK